MSETMILSGMQIYTEQGILKNAAVEINRSVIQSFGNSESKSKKQYTFPASYHLVPGFIDLHVHGANGKDVMDANNEALSTIGSTLAAEGVTGFLATTMTAPAKQIESALLTVREHVKSSDQKGAQLLGVHLEGPFISPEKIGAQNAKHLLPLDIQLVQQWQQLSGENIRLLTLAPELNGSDDFIRELKLLSIIPSIGHSNATYDESLRAIAKGCSHITHLFNAMRGIHQREPGIVTAALLSDVTAEIIADGIHVHPALLQLILKMKGTDKVILITDAMRAKCMHEGCYELGGQEVHVKNSVAQLADGTLAGSTLKMSSAIKNMMKYTGCDLLDAIKIASANPAKKLGIFSKKGSIAVGKDADLVVLDENLNVMMTIVQGNICYSASSVALA
jgi:N-acetylglucosamine-6-phosphate deacetylase